MVYDEPVSEGCGPCCAELDRMERFCLRELLDRDKPVFGICRGLQFLNAALGGTLYQDLPSERPARHIAPPDAVGRCAVPFGDACRGKSAASAAARGYDFGQQLSSSGGENARAAAFRGGAVGGRLVEAVWMPSKRFVRAVQWHPELSFMTDENSGAFRGL